MQINFLLHLLIFSLKFVDSISCLSFDLMKGIWILVFMVEKNHGHYLHIVLDFDVFFSNIIFLRFSIENWFFISGLFYKWFIVDNNFFEECRIVSVKIILDQLYSVIASISMERFYNRFISKSWNIEMLL
jgi:hypothetical protein